jgi:DNA-binding Lrp family transcriptional regulator
MVQLDNISGKILGILAMHARMSIVDLAEHTGLSRDIISYRIKKMCEDKIIVQYRCSLNLPELGIRHYKLILRMTNFTNEAEKQIKAYISMHKKATQLLKIIGSYDLEIEYEVESEDELYSIITELRQEFASYIRDYDIIHIMSTRKLNLFPFNAEQGQIPSSQAESK